MRELAVLVALSCLTSAPVAAPRVEVSPSDGLVDVPLRVIVTGLLPGERVAITVRFDDATNTRWTARAHFRADPAGSLDTAHAASLGGTYDGVQPGGLSCSALPAIDPDVATIVQRLAERPGRTRPVFADASSYRAIVELTTSGGQSVTRGVRRRFLSPTVTIEPVRNGRVIGRYYRPATSGLRAPVVVVGGSGGGVPARAAMLLASHGHPVLALAYFAHVGLPPHLQSIPIETFAEGAAWLAARAQAEKVALLGASRGSEAVLLTAAHFPAHVAAVIAAVPAPIVHGPFGPGIDPHAPAWTLAGQPIPNFTFGPAVYDRWDRGTGTAAFPGIATVEDFRPAWRAPESLRRFGVPYDRLNVPLLALGGDQDLVWPSGEGVRIIERALRALGKGGLVETHVYSAAGHDILSVGTGSAISASSLHPATNRWFRSGGTAAGNCHASFDSWRVILDFLHRRAAPERVRRASESVHGDES